MNNSQLMPITDDYRAHQDLLQNILEKTHSPWKVELIHDIGLVDCHNDQMLVLQTYTWGPSEVETVTVVGLYTREGNVSVAVNHINGLATLDDANLMFPPKES